MENRQEGDFPAEKRVLRAAAAIQEENARIRRMTGADFTPFVPKIIDLDENTASYILKIFLDPRGSHGQGALFLKKFLGLLPISGTHDLEPERAREAAVEKPTYGSGRNRRIDVFIGFDNVVLGVENKLGAGDQERQLADYLDWLKKRSDVYYMVYLTPDGREPSEWSLPEDARDRHKDHYFTLSWKKVVDALEDAAQCVPLKISLFLDDFCAAIKKKIGEDSMSFDIGVAKYLANGTSEAELKAAYGIYTVYKQVASLLVDDWGKRLGASLAGKIRGNVKVNREEWDDPRATVYFAISYDSLGMQVEVAHYDTERHFGIPQGTLLLGVYRWSVEPLAEPLAEALTARFNTQAISGMLTATEAGRLEDPDFLAKIRKEEPLYLFDEIVAKCRQIEEVALAFGMEI